MKKILIFIVLLLFLFSCKNGSINDKSKRNQNWAWWVDAKTGKAEWIPVVSDQTPNMSGRYTTFYFNGQKYKEGKLLNGVDVDTTFIYSLDGELIAYDLIKHDTEYIFILKDGCFKRYYQDGKLLSEGIVKNHRYAHPSIDYYENGQIKAKSAYTLDSVCILMRYYDNGQIKDSGFVPTNDTFFSCKRWYENGQVEIVRNYINNLQEGTMKEYYKTPGQIESSLKTISNWKNGIEDGVQIDYYENGQIKDSAYLIGKIPNGIVKYWRENGSLELILNIKDGKILDRKKYDSTGTLIPSVSLY